MEKHKSEEYEHREIPENTITTIEIGNVNDPDIVQKTIERQQEVAHEIQENARKTEEEDKTYNALRELLGLVHDNSMTAYEQALFEKNQELQKENENLRSFIDGRSVAKEANIESTPVGEQKYQDAEPELTLNNDIDSNIHKHNGVDTVAEKPIESDDLDYKNFIETGVVSDEKLRSVANMIKNGITMSNKDISIYTEKAQQIEAILKENPKVINVEIPAVELVSNQSKKEIKSINKPQEYEQFTKNNTNENTDGETILLQEQKKLEGEMNDYISQVSMTRRGLSFLEENDFLNIEQIAKKFDQNNTEISESLREYGKSLDNTRKDLINSAKNSSPEEFSNQFRKLRTLGVEVTEEPFNNARRKLI